MLSKGDIARLRHMHDAAKEAISFIRNRTRSDLDKDRMLALSVLKCIEIVGEAASKLSKECRNKFSHLPWNNIITMRNRLIHAYFDINLDVVWSTVTEDLPPLIAELEEAIRLINNSS